MRPFSADAIDLRKRRVNADESGMPKSGSLNTSRSAVLTFLRISFFVAVVIDASITLLTLHSNNPSSLHRDGRDDEISGRGLKTPINFRVQLYCFFDILFSVLERITFRNTAGKRGNRSSVPAFFRGSKHDCIGICIFLKFFHTPQG